MREFFATQADDLYELVTERQAKSLVITANRAGVDWYSLFPNPVVAAVHPRPRRQRFPPGPHGRQVRSAEQAAQAGSQAVSETRTCWAEGCDNPVPPRIDRGHPFTYCSASCRPTQQRKHPTVSLVAEIDHTPTKENTRPAGRIWSVRLRRGTRVVIIAEELGRPSADHLVRQINELVGVPSSAEGNAIE